MTTEALMASVVALGNFAPAMFHPSWFARHGLIAEAEAAASAKSPGLSISDAHATFAFSGIEFHALHDRLQFATSREDMHHPLKDLVASTLALLDATPVSSMGINWSKHSKAPNEDKWHEFGHRLAPKEFWNKNWTGHAGMLRVHMRLERTDSKLGSVNVNVDPSSEIRPGIYCRFNDHYEFSEKSASAGFAALLINEVWGSSKESALKMIRALEEDLNNG